MFEVPGRDGIGNCITPLGAFGTGIGAPLIYIATNLISVTRCRNLESGQVMCTTNLDDIMFIETTLWQFEVCRPELRFTQSITVTTTCSKRQQFEVHRRLGAT